MWHVKGRTVERQASACPGQKEDPWGSWRAIFRGLWRHHEGGRSKNPI